MALERPVAEKESLSDQPSQLSSPWIWGFLLALFAILQRLFLWFHYQPITFSDTYGGYMRLAEVLLDFTLKGYDGTRVPLYPAFLASLRMDEEKIWFVQMLLGVIIVLLLYWITWRTTTNIALGLLVAGIYAFLPAHVLMEANLLTETLTTFWVVLSYALLLIYLQRPQRGRTLIVLLLLGVSVSAAGMTRALFFPVSIWFLIFVFFGAGEDWKSRILNSAVYCIGPILILGGWVWFIYDLSGMLAPTTRVGYNLVQHTGAFFEHLPDQYAPIRDTYLEYRDARIAERGVQHNTIWDALPAMAESSGLHFFQLSRELQRLSWMLIRQHPDLFLRSALEGWINFWKAPVIWKVAAFDSEAFGFLYTLLSYLNRALALGANLVFLVISFGIVVSGALRARLKIDLFAISIMGGVWLISVFQTIFEHGDNPRFLVPQQMMVIYFAVRSLWFLFDGRRTMETLTP